MNNYLISFSLLSISALSIYVFRRKTELLLSSLKIFTKTQLYINDLLSKLSNKKDDDIKKINNFKPKNIKIKGDLLSLEYNFYENKQNIKNIFNDLQYYEGTINIMLEYTYFNKLYYFIYTDIPEQCLEKLDKLINLLKIQNKKINSNVLSAILTLDDNEIDITNIIQKYEGALLDFSFNSIRLFNIIENENSINIDIDNINNINNIKLDIIDNTASLHTFNTINQLIKLNN